MMRSDELTQPMVHERAKRLSGTTLCLAEQYMTLVRKADHMSNKKPLFFKRWRRARLDQKAMRLRVDASSTWRELYLRFRPLFSSAIYKASAQHMQEGSTPRDAVIEIVMGLESLMIREPENNCFSDMVWRAMEHAVRPYAASISNLKASVFLRTIFDSCPNLEAVTTINLLVYLRGENFALNNTPVPELSDIEQDSLLNAFDAIEEYLRSLGKDLDLLTGGVFSSEELSRTPPRSFILNCF